MWKTSTDSNPPKKQESGNTCKTGESETSETTRCGKSTGRAMLSSQWGSSNPIPPSNEKSMKNLKNSISIEVYQEDWIPGFAAYHIGTLTKEAKAHVVLNIGSLLALVGDGSIQREELPYVVAESLMHEVIHVLEEWAGVEFSEERVHALTEAYTKKYSKL